MAIIEQASRTVLHLYGAARECRLDEFHEEALRLLKQTLHFDSGAVIQASLGARGIDVHSMHNHRQPIEKLHDRANLHGADPTLIKAIQRAGHCLTDELTSLDPHHHHDIIAYAKKYDVAYSLVLVSPIGAGRSADVISLWRAPQGKHYGETGRRIADLLLPHYLQAKNMNEGYWRVCDRKLSTDEAILIANVDGCLRYVDANAVASLRHEWPNWSPPMLPPTLFDCLRLRERGHWVGRRIRAELVVLGNAIYIHVIKRAIDTTLTPAESRVAWLAAQGKAYKEIADDLGTSLSTVRNQLHQVYRKLGVNSKAALGHRLMTPSE